MPKRTQTPTQTCPQCGARIVYLLQGRRTRACELERIAVITADGVTAIGWRRHKCNTIKDALDAMTKGDRGHDEPQGEE